MIKFIETEISLLGFTSIRDYLKSLKILFLF